MLAKIILENVPHTSFFLASSRDQPDKFRFEVVPGKEHLVQRVIPVEQFAKEAPEMLSLFGYPDTAVAIVFEKEPRDATGAADEVIEEITKQLEAAQKQLKDLRVDHNQALGVIHELRNQQQADQQKGDRITDDQIAQLGLYDQMLEVLKPLAGEMETPLDVVIRLSQIGAPPECDSDTVQEIDEPAPPVFDEAKRRAELEKMTLARLKKLAKPIEGSGDLKTAGDLIEAILMHEAGAPQAS